MIKQLAGFFMLPDPILCHIDLILSDNPQYGHEHKTKYL
ncbi:hypothetical protein J699_00646 [Acinetobacter sp. 1000160]|nr:hypothetical protein J522_2412 [Acinetobacter baumannii 146457]EYT23717.1 hypothetical protein J699_00646 [Acinetobacter sp. 1000160]